MIPGREDQDEALLELLHRLAETGYRFVTATPKTQALVLGRDPDREAQSIVDVLGWSRQFRAGTIDSEAERLLDQAGVIEVVGERKRATIRVSSLGDHLFIHSAFPTTAPDSIFFGPDSYRFARFLSEQLIGSAARSVIDIGTGSGVGAVVASSLMPMASIVMTDINPSALRLARINARAAGIVPSVHCGDVLADVAGSIEIAIANPPYIIDPDHRAYRDGGGMHGAELSLRMTRAVLGRLAVGGCFLLYTGSAIIDGEDQLLREAHEVAAAAACVLDYGEIDPDVFGEELQHPAYGDVERIAVVGAVFRRQ